MEKRIAELEQERVAQLEHERVTQLEQYLVAAGLEDYELTEEDKKTLNEELYRSSAFVTLMTKKFTDYQRFSLL